ncbi:MAG: hypothetical protein JWM27_4579 [Gemmatimonadetes bacterium]|nr:hypothetical protein [Gemmatimonadota bacterium]
MSHDETMDLLDDFVAGELGDADRERVSAHLAACDACRADADALRALLADAAALPRGIAPGRDLWADIAPRLQPRAPGDGDATADIKVIPLFPRGGRTPRWLLAAAAVVLVAVSSAVTARMVRRGEQVAVGGALPRVTVERGSPVSTAGTRPIGVGTPDPASAQNPAPGPSAEPSSAPVGGSTVDGRMAGGRTVDGGTETVRPQAAGAALASNRRTGAQGTVVNATALAAFRPAEREYRRAADDLEGLLRAQRSRMAPETAATLDRNLRIIDRAIRESRAALLKDPNNRELTQMLSGVYDTKIQTLQRAVQL